MDLKSLLATAMLRKMQPEEMPTVIPPNIRHEGMMPQPIKPVPPPSSDDPFIPLDPSRIPHKTTETYWDRQKRRKKAFQKFFSGK